MIPRIMRGTTVVIVILLLITNPLVVAGQTGQASIFGSYQLPDPGSLPGERWYGVERWWERVQEFFALGDERRVQIQAAHAEERLAEVNTLMAAHLAESLAALPHMTTSTDDEDPINVGDSDVGGAGSLVTLDLESLGEVSTPLIILENDGLEFIDSDAPASPNTPIGAGASSTAAVGGETTANNTPPTSCTDTDGGRDYHVRGDVRGNTETGGWGVFTDSCRTDRTLLEFYCQADGKTRGFEEVSCQATEKCQNGACVKATGGTTIGSCTDSDGGRNLTVQGTTQGSNVLGPQQGTDQCVGFRGITEYYCKANGEFESELTSCPIGQKCENGACVFYQNTNLTCLDKDNGKIYDQRAKTEGYDDAGVWQDKEDECVYGQNKVTEWYCDNGKIKSETHDCGTGKQCIYGACVSAQIRCTDSDGGRNIYQKGTLEHADASGNRTTKVDVCDGQRFVTEYYCTLTENYESGRYYCGPTSVCTDGECRPESAPNQPNPACTDSDGGKNANQKGQTRGKSSTGYYSTWEDSCASQNSVTEYYCARNGQVDSEFINCGSGKTCQDGVCVSTTAARPSVRVSSYQYQLPDGLSVDFTRPPKTRTQRSDFFLDDQYIRGIRAEREQLIEETLMVYGQTVRRMIAEAKKSEATTLTEALSVFLAHVEIVENIWPYLPPERQSAVISSLAAIRAVEGELRTEENPFVSEETRTKVLGVVADAQLRRVVAKTAVQNGLCANGMVANGVCLSGIRLNASCTAGASFNGVCLSSQQSVKFQTIDWREVSWTPAIGNIYVSDNVLHESLEKDKEGSGNIQFGDSTFGTTFRFGGFMFAEHSFLANNVNSNAFIYGNMTAGGQGSMASSTVKGPLNGIMNGAMNGVLNGTMNGIMNGVMNGVMNGSMNGIMNGTLNGTLNGAPQNGTINGTLNGVLNGTINGTLNGTLNGTFNGTVNGTMNGTLNGTFYGIIRRYPPGLTQTVPCPLARLGEDGCDDDMVTGTPKRKGPPPKVPVTDTTNKKTYFIDGNILLHYPSTFSFSLILTNGQEQRITGGGRAIPTENGILYAHALTVGGRNCDVEIRELRSVADQYIRGNTILQGRPILRCEARDFSVVTDEEVKKEIEDYRERLEEYTAVALAMPEKTIGNNGGYAARLENHAKTFAPVLEFLQTSDTAPGILDTGRAIAAALVPTLTEPPSRNTTLPSPLASVDINRDGEINERDVSTITNIVRALPSSSIARCDINSDGLIDERDRERLGQMMQQLQDISGDVQINGQDQIMISGIMSTVGSCILRSDPVTQTITINGIVYDITVTPDGTVQLHERSGSDEFTFSGRGPSGTIDFPASPGPSTGSLPSGGSTGASDTPTSPLSCPRGTTPFFNNQIISVAHSRISSSDCSADATTNLISMRTNSQRLCTERGGTFTPGPISVDNERGFDGTYRCRSAQWVMCCVPTAVPPATSSTPSPTPPPAPTPVPLPPSPQPQPTPTPPPAPPSRLVPPTTSTPPTTPPSPGSAGSVCAGGQYYDPAGSFGCNASRCPFGCTFDSATRCPNACLSESGCERHTSASACSAQFDCQWMLRGSVSQCELKPMGVETWENLFPLAE